MTGFTFDTGALIAMERKKLAFMQRLKRMQEARAVITLPAVVIAEWWRGGSHATNFNMLNAFRVEPTGWSLAKLAGEAIAKNLKTMAGSTLPYLPPLMSCSEYKNRAPRTRGRIKDTRPLKDIPCP